MADLINAIIIVVFGVGIVVIASTVIFLAYWQTVNSQFYVRWQRKRRERITEKFVNSIKRRNPK